MWHLPGATRDPAKRTPHKERGATMGKGMARQWHRPLYLRGLRVSRSYILIITRNFHLSDRRYGDNAEATQYSKLWDFSGQGGRSDNEPNYSGQAVFQDFSRELCLQALNHICVVKFHWEPSKISQFKLFYLKQKSLKKTLTWPYCAWDPGLLITNCHRLPNYSLVWPSKATLRGKSADSPWGLQGNFLDQTQDKDKSSRIKRDWTWRKPRWKESMQESSDHMPWQLQLGKSWGALKPI